MGWGGDGDLFTSPFESMWLGDTRGETLFSGELLRKTWGCISGLVCLSTTLDPVVSHIVRDCKLTVVVGSWMAEVLGLMETGSSIWVPGWGTVPWWLRKNCWMLGAWSWGWCWKAGTETASSFFTTTVERA